MDGTISWGWVIFLVLILWFFVGGGLGLNNRTNTAEVALGERLAYENRIATIQETATTQFKTVDEADKTRDLIRQVEADRQAVALVDAKNEINYLKLDNANEKRFNALQSQIELFACQTPQRPPYYAQGCYPCGGCNGNGTTF